MCYKFFVTFRLQYAQDRRKEQLEIWEEYERAQNQLQNGHGKKRIVKFRDCITLLEAAARCDYDEGKSVVICLRIQSL